MITQSGSVAAKISTSRPGETTSGYEGSDPKNFSDSKKARLSPKTFLRRATLYETTTPARACFAAPTEV